MGEFSFFRRICLCIFLIPEIPESGILLSGEFRWVWDAVWECFEHEKHMRIEKT